MLSPSRVKSIGPGLLPGPGDQAHSGARIRKDLTCISRYWVGPPDRRTLCRSLSFSFGIASAAHVDHRLGRAGGRHGRLCLPAPTAHLPAAGRRRGDSRWAAAEGTEAGRGAGRRFAGRDRAAASSVPAAALRSFPHELDAAGSTRQVSARQANFAVSWTPRAKLGILAKKSS